MKVLFISALYKPYIGGGAEISNQLLVEGISKNGIKVEVITLGKKNTIEFINGVKIRRIYLGKIYNQYLDSILVKKERGRILKIKLTILKVLLYFNLFFISKVKKIIKESRIEILHTSGVHLFFPSLWWKVANGEKIKVIHTIRDPLFLYFRGVDKGKKYTLLDLFQRRYYRYFLNKYVDLVHAPSEFMIEKHEKMGFIFKNTKVIYNTDVDLSLSKKDEIKTSDIIYVGNLDVHKGVKNIIELKKHRNLKIVCVGDGKLKNECSENGIITLGWISRERVIEEISKAKVLILPSIWEEAFGRVLLEAINNGTLAIGSDKGAIPEILGKNSKYIFKSGDLEEIIEKTERILKLSEEEYDIELKNMQEYAKKFSYDKHIEKFIELYQSVGE